ncbi:MAG: F0F1 ATP synthase subunit A [Eubacteriales bacterium]|nr:F0F1 ATP synthase subunit A [Eubacteriales bacterium]
MGLMLSADVDFMIHGVVKLPFKFLSQEVWISDSIITTCLVSILIFIFALFANRAIVNAKEYPSGFQNFVEMLIEALDNMTKGILGENSYRFKYYIGTIFCFIIVSNLSGLLGLRAPTADYGITFLLGMFTFFIVQFQNIKNNKFRAITNLFQPTPVLFPINLIGELANPLSISLRLFANMLSGVIIMGLWYGMLPIFVKIGIPSFLHIYCDLFSGAIQTYVFCMLSMVYINDKL